METNPNANGFELGDQLTSDVVVHLRNTDGRAELFYCHSSVLVRKSIFFASRLSNLQTLSTGRCPNSHGTIEVQCSGSEYEHYIKLLRLLYLPENSISESWESANSAIGVLQASITLGCEGLTQSCCQYLEAVPWDDKEEEEILKLAPSLGPSACSLLARIQPVSLHAVKNVFISAIRFAMSIEKPLPPFTDELKVSAQEQVEYMLLNDEDTPLISAEEDVKSEVKFGLSKMFSTLEMELSSLVKSYDLAPETSEQRILQSLSDLEWMCNILPKIDMMGYFISHWVEISAHLLTIVLDEKYCSSLWAVKAKLIEVAGKALDAVADGTVTLPAPMRLKLLKAWLRYIRNMKPLLDSKRAADGTYPYQMDPDLCQNIEGAILSLVLSLPSNDQADILTEWMSTRQLKYPDLREAFEMWCYRTKSAERRVGQRLNGISNSTVTL